MAAIDVAAHGLPQRVPRRRGAGEFGVTEGQAVELWCLDRIEHRAARWPRRIGHITVPGFARSPDANRLSVFGDVGHHDHFRIARHTPPLAKNVERDLAKAAS